MKTKPFQVLGLFAFLLLTLIQPGSLLAQVGGHSEKPLGYFQPTPMYSAPFHWQLPDPAHSNWNVGLPEHILDWDSDTSREFCLDVQLGDELIDAGVLNEGYFTPHTFSERCNDYQSPMYSARLGEEFAIDDKLVSPHQLISVMPTFWPLCKVALRMLNPEEGWANFAIGWDFTSQSGYNYTGCWGWGDPVSVPGSNQANRTASQLYSMDGGSDYRQDMEDNVLPYLDFPVLAALDPVNMAFELHQVDIPSQAHAGRTLPISVAQGTFFANPRLEEDSIGNNFDEAIGTIGKFFATDFRNDIAILNNIGAENEGSVTLIRNTSLNASYTCAKTVMQNVCAVDCTDPANSAACQACFSNAAQSQQIADGLNACPMTTRLTNESVGPTFALAGSQNPVFIGVIPDARPEWPEPEDAVEGCQVIISVDADQIAVAEVPNTCANACRNCIDCANESSCIESCVADLAGSGLNSGDDIVPWVEAQGWCQEAEACSVMLPQAPSDYDTADELATVSGLCGQACVCGNCALDPEGSPQGGTLAGCIDSCLGNFLNANTLAGGDLVPWVTAQPWCQGAEGEGGSCPVMLPTSADVLGEGLEDTLCTAACSCITCNPDPNNPALCYDTCRGTLDNPPIETMGFNLSESLETTLCGGSPGPSENLIPPQGSAISCPPLATANANNIQADDKCRLACMCACGTGSDCPDSPCEPATAGAPQSICMGGSCIEGTWGPPPACPTGTTSVHLPDYSDAAYGNAYYCLESNNCSSECGGLPLDSEDYCADHMNIGANPNPLLNCAAELCATIDGGKGAALDYIISSAHAGGGGGGEAIANPEGYEGGYSEFLRGEAYNVKGHELPEGTGKTMQWDMNALGMGGGNLPAHMQAAIASFIQNIFLKMTAGRLVVINRAPTACYPTDGRIHFRNITTNADGMPLDMGGDGFNITDTTGTPIWHNNAAEATMGPGAGQSMTGIETCDYLTFYDVELDADTESIPVAVNPVLGSDGNVLKIPIFKNGTSFAIGDANGDGWAFDIMSANTGVSGQGYHGSVTSFFCAPPFEGLQLTGPPHPLCGAGVAIVDDEVIKDNTASKAKHPWWIVARNLAGEKMTIDDLVQSVLGGGPIVMRMPSEAVITYLDAATTSKDNFSVLFNTAQKRYDHVPPTEFVYDTQFEFESYPTETYATDDPGDVTKPLKKLAGNYGPYPLGVDTFVRNNPYRDTLFGLDALLRNMLAEWFSGFDFYPDSWMHVPCPEVAVGLNNTRQLGLWPQDEPPVTELSYPPLEEDGKDVVIEVGLCVGKLAEPEFKRANTPIYQAHFDESNQTGHWGPKHVTAFQGNLMTERAFTSGLPDFVSFHMDPLSDPPGDPEVTADDQVDASEDFAMLSGAPLKIAEHCFAEDAFCRYSLPNDRCASDRFEQSTVIADSTNEEGADPLTPHSCLQNYHLQNDAAGVACCMLLSDPGHEDALEKLSATRAALLGEKGISCPGKDPMECCRKQLTFANIDSNDDNDWDFVWSEGVPSQPVDVMPSNYAGEGQGVCECPDIDDTLELLKIAMFENDVAAVQDAIEALCECMDEDVAGLCDDPKDHPQTCAELGLPPALKDCCQDSLAGPVFNDECLEGGERPDCSDLFAGNPFLEECCDRFGLANMDQCFKEDCPDCPPGRPGDPCENIADPVVQACCEEHGLSLEMIECLPVPDPDPNDPNNQIQNNACTNFANIIAGGNVTISGQLNICCQWVNVENSVINAMNGVQNCSNGLQEGGGVPGVPPIVIPGVTEQPEINCDSLALMGFTPIECLPSCQADPTQPHCPQGGPGATPGGGTIVGGPTAMSCPPGAVTVTDADGNLLSEVPAWSDVQLHLNLNAITDASGKAMTTVVNAAKIAGIAGPKVRVFVEQGKTFTYFRSLTNPDSFPQLEGVKAITLAGLEGKALIAEGDAAALPEQVFEVRHALPDGGREQQKLKIEIASAEMAVPTACAPAYDVVMSLKGGRGADAKGGCSLTTDGGQTQSIGLPMLWLLGLALLPLTVLRYQRLRVRK